VLAPTFYWTIPELCVAVIAACLPTLRPIFYGWSPESIVGSIRSIISLRSLDSQGNQSTRSNRNNREGYIRTEPEWNESMANLSASSGKKTTMVGYDSMPLQALSKSDTQT